MRRTKILATIGPATSSEAMIRALVEAGADAIRLNFSHGNHHEHGRLISLIRQVSRELDRHVPIVGDIQGPKIRIGEVYGVVPLRSGQAFTIRIEPMIGNEREVSTPFVELTEQVRRGERILINDGLVELEVLEVLADRVHTRIVHGGPISSKKGINFPDTELSIPSITAKDELDLQFAAEKGVDYVAASFVQRREDVERVRELLRTAGGGDIGVIAKLEKKLAIDSLDEILEVSDGVMVARGDLGVELPPETVPVIQKQILSRAAQKGRFAITATQMLESMTTSSRPTRAEASDVANAIFDGSDAVMLSAETASGSYPVEAVAMMARIVVEAERNPELRVQAVHMTQREAGRGSYTDALAGASHYAAQQISARYIVVFTQTGFTARLMSKFRPQAPIIGLTPTAEVARRMNLLWGVVPFVLPQVGEFHEQIVEQVENFLLGNGRVVEGDVVAILMGSPIYQQARTNLLRLHQIGWGKLIS